jgi:hypothetical protein
MRCRALRGASTLAVKVNTGLSVWRGRVVVIRVVVVSVVDAVAVGTIEGAAPRSAVLKSRD